MAAGEAHWQIGIVETHIRILVENVLLPKRDDRHLTETVRNSGGSELSVRVK